jgi:hypothetical protein
MIVEQGKNPFYETAIAEHRELRQILERIEAAVQEIVDPASPKLIQRLTQELEGLAKHLSEHFRQEEAGGYLEEAVTRLPRLASLVDSLERQHPPLEKQLSVLIGCARAAQDIGTLKRMFESFCTTLLAHEAAEDRVLEEAFGAFQVH